MPIRRMRARQRVGEAKKGALVYLRTFDKAPAPVVASNRVRMCDVVSVVRPSRSFVRLRFVLGVRLR
eukprot:2115892-Prymnesium_polylepis.2